MKKFKKGQKVWYVCGPECVCSAVACGKELEEFPYFFKSEEDALNNRLDEIDEELDELNKKIRVLVDRTKRIEKRLSEIMVTCAICGKHFNGENEGDSEGEWFFCDACSGDMDSFIFEQKAINKADMERE